MTRWLAVIALLMLGPAPLPAQEREPIEPRQSVIARAQLRLPGDVASRNLRTGPEGPGSFATGATVTCDYLDKKLGGLSPKFACRTADGDELKVKYGGTNGEVYGEVAASRLIWALGFGADRMYSVRVICRGCPAIAGSIRQANGDRIIDPAAVERNIAGAELLSEWSFEELDLVDPAQGGASVADRDAMKLLAVFLQHADSKPQQQRAICLDEPAGPVLPDRPATPARCATPLLLMHDVGITFGRAYRIQPRASMDLSEWAKLPTWRDGPGCVGHLGGSLAATLVNPAISEAGRALLADLMMQLSDDQLLGMFEAARVHLRPRDPNDGRSGFPAAAEWVEAFRQKRSQIVDRRCDQASTASR